MKIVPLTTDLVERVIPVYLDAFRGYPNALLGPPYVRRFLGWFIDAPDGIALAALDESGEVLGFVAGAPVGYGERMNRHILPVVARQMLLRPWVLLHRRVLYAVVMRLKTMFSPKTQAAAREQGANGVVSLVAIGTASARRRGGVGAALVRAFEAEAVRAGARMVRLSVYADNAGARALYERSGWRCVTDGEAVVVYYAREIEPS